MSGVGVSNKFRLKQLTPRRASGEYFGGEYILFKWLRTNIKKAEL